MMGVSFLELDGVLFFIFEEFQLINEGVLVVIFFGVYQMNDYGVFKLYVENEIVMIFFGDNQMLIQELFELFVGYVIVMIYVGNRLFCLLFVYGVFCFNGGRLKRFDVGWL